MRVPACPSQAVGAESELRAKPLGTGLDKSWARPPGAQGLMGGQCRERGLLSETEVQILAQRPAAIRTLGQELPSPPLSQLLRRINR